MEGREEGRERARRREERREGVRGRGGKEGVVCFSRNIYSNRRYLSRSTPLDLFPSLCVEGVVKRARKTIKGMLQDRERHESRMVGRGGGGSRPRGEGEGGKEGRKEGGRRSIRPRVKGKRGM